MFGVVRLTLEHEIFDAGLPGTGRVPVTGINRINNVQLDTENDYVYIDSSDNNKAVHDSLQLTTDAARKASGYTASLHQELLWGLGGTDMVHRALDEVVVRTTEPCLNGKAVVNQSDCATFTTAEPTTFEDLDDDCLRIIIDHLAEDSDNESTDIESTDVESAESESTTSSEVEDEWVEVPAVEAFASVNGRMRELCLPKIFALDNMIVSLKKGASELDLSLQAMLESSFVTDALTQLSINFKFCKRNHEWSDPDQSQSSKNDARNDAYANTTHKGTDLYDVSDLFKNLHDVLIQSSRLHDLTITNHICNTAAEMESALQSASFDSTLTLKISNTYAIPEMIAACPNLRTLSLILPCANQEYVFEVIATQSRITSVVLEHKDAWTASELTGICANLSHVKSLVLLGKIKERATDFAPAFTQLSNLQHLQLSTRIWVDLNEFRQRSRLRKWPIYWDSAMAKQDAAKKLSEWPSRLAEAVFDAWPALVTFRVLQERSVEDFEMRLSDDDDGSVEVAQILEMELSMKKYGPFPTRVYSNQLVLEENWAEDDWEEDEWEEDE